MPICLLNLHKSSTYMKCKFKMPGNECVTEWSGGGVRVDGCTATSGHCVSQEPHRSTGPTAVQQGQLFGLL